MFLGGGGGVYRAYCRPTRKYIFLKYVTLLQISVRYRVRRQSGFPTFISCQRQDANVLPKRRQWHQGDKLCDVSTVSLVARWPVFLARGSDADGEPHCGDVSRNENGSCTAYMDGETRTGKCWLPRQHFGPHEASKDEKCHLRPAPNTE